MPEDNLYKRGDVWWLRATINGIECRESLRTGDVKDARRKRDARLKKIKDEIRDGRQAVSWKKAVAEWFEHEQGQIAATTIKRYSVSFAQCEPILSPYPVAKIDGKVINALIASRRKNGATPATIRRDLTAVSRVLEYAEAQEWREGNPTLSKRRLLKERRDPIQLPTDAAIAAVMSAASDRFAAMITAARLTGCRQDELVNVTWPQFSAAAKTLDVIGKGNKRRTIELSDTAAAQISAHPRTLGSKLIFCRESGESFAQAASDFCHFRRAAAAKSDFPRFRFHDLRHLYAVESLRGGMDIYTLSKQLGHTSVKTTEIYLDFLTADEAQRAKQGLAQKDGTPRRFDDAETA
jgi:integrase/recombinase XerD